MFSDSSFTALIVMLLSCNLYTVGPALALGKPKYLKELIYIEHFNF